MIPMQWTANVANDPSAKQSFEDYLSNNQRLLLRLKEIIEDKEKSTDDKDFSLSSFDNPSWAYKQAHINGRRAVLNEIKQLITITG